MRLSILRQSQWPGSRRSSGMLRGSRHGILGLGQLRLGAIRGVVRRPARPVLPAEGEAHLEAPGLCLLVCPESAEEIDTMVGRAFRSEPYYIVEFTNEGVPRDPTPRTFLAPSVRKDETFE